jgi:hypothetical protein
MWGSLFFLKNHSAQAIDPANQVRFLIKSGPYEHYAPFSTNQTFWAAL